MQWDAVERQRDSLSPFENFETLTLDFFSQADYFPLENLMLSAGFNWDMLFTLNSHFERTDRTVRIDAFSPTGSAIYTPLPETRLHATIAKRSNLPRMQSLFGRVVGNLDLQPEHTLSFEAGVTQSFWNKRFVAEATFFYNDVDNIIELQDRPAPITSAPGVTSFVEYANTNSYETLGG